MKVSYLIDTDWVVHHMNGIEEKRSGIYEQNKLLYEDGGLNLYNLPEEAMANVEEDYQVCVRSLARELGSDKKKETTETQSHGGE